MKASGIFKGSLLALALLLATSAFAANKGSLQIYDTITVAGKQLPAGTYTAKWEGNGPAVELSILKGKNVVATVPAQMVTLPRSLDHDSAVVSTNSDGSRSLSEVRFAGKNYSLQLTSGSSGSGAASGSR
jgi:hypothetical protein